MSPLTCAENLRRIELRGWISPDLVDTKNRRVCSRMKERDAGNYS